MRYINPRFTYFLLLSRTFATSRTVLEKFDVQSNDLEISPMSSTVASPESIMYIYVLFLFLLSDFPKFPQGFFNTQPIVA